MSKKKWLLPAAGLLLLGGLGVALVLALALGCFAGHETASAGGLGLAIYHVDQTASAHAGYRHDTLTCGREVYVNDYEEACLQLACAEPPTTIGHYLVGGGKVCAIPGQPTTAYIAGDVGSEMPAYVPYRHLGQPPFDWRTATFRELTANRPGSRHQYLTTTNAALLAEVVNTLRDGTPVNLPAIPFANITQIPTLTLTSDQLPGMLFCPPIYFAADGSIYLAESFMLDATVTPPQLHARWITASPTLADWLKTP